MGAAATLAAGLARSRTGSLAGPLAGSLPLALPGIPPLALTIAAWLALTLAPCLALILSLSLILTLALPLILVLTLTRFLIPGRALALPLSLTVTTSLAAGLPFAPVRVGATRPAFPARTIATARRSARSLVTAGLARRRCLAPRIGHMQLALRIESGLDERRMLPVAKRQLGAMTVDPAHLLQRTDSRAMDRMHPRAEQQGVRLHVTEFGGELDAQVQRGGRKRNHRAGNALTNGRGLLRRDRGGGIGHRRQWLGIGLRLGGSDVRGGGDLLRRHDRGVVTAGVRRGTDRHRRLVSGR